jgi:dolichol-phosphate mannosyltransferase
MLIAGPKVPVIPPRSSPWLSVLAPVYNEERTVDALLRRLRNGPYPDKEVIVVDDGSTDDTPAILARWAGEAGFLVLRHPSNRGKGAAVRTALAHARGQIAVIQDADLEYDPAGLPGLIEPIRRGESEVVYGSRYLGSARPLPWSRFRLAVCGVNLLVRLLYGQRLTDEATCYKAFRMDLLRALAVRARGFELCAELTAKVCRAGRRIVEVPVRYQPRTAAEGKKIGWRDCWPTVWALIKWRFLQVTTLLADPHHGQVGAPGAEPRRSPFFPWFSASGRRCSPRGRAGQASKRATAVKIFGHNGLR